MALHIVNQSPFRNTALAECAAVFAESDTLLLTEDGVYALLAMDKLAPFSSIYVLESDAVARGIDVQSPAKTTDYDGWVNLCTNHMPIVSWFG
ncbi:sulfurtransferase complex subunit TusB [Biformimicrobium ophioploci]|uniref:Sulfurtransferase complex subunit TusB n=1 Tax=Biformimicrobium ophioploci TaxID=3036711 RepID=A0ABQ6M1X2_9GAMM|nr:sulfurtransferase complex subunit TusB [Microbulbifer sp. NKW57]GMG88306.1 sulfurtransferase complex subunit TusB [Microbulbifer sp. NKW57]